jgi:hypothetical protein
MAKFCFPKLEAAALFAVEHGAVGVHIETVAHFDLFFVTVPALPKMVKFHDRISR